MYKVIIYRMFPKQCREREKDRRKKGVFNEREKERGEMNMRLIQVSPS